MNTDSIEYQQLFLLRKAKKYLDKKKEQGIDTALSSFCYLNSWSNVPGYSILKWWQKGFATIGSFVSVNLRFFLSIAGLSAYDLFTNSKVDTYSKMVVSWCRREDFDKSGIYFDRYFKTNIKSEKKTLWFLISIDNYVPDNLDEHIFLFAKRKNGLKINIPFLISKIGSLLKKNRFSLRKTLYLSSSASVLAQMIGDKVASLLKANKITSIVLPYEAQPLHHAIFKEAKKFDPSIVTKGYLHSALPPLMTDLFYRDGAPDILYVHGNGQIKILKEYLNWPDQHLKFIPSLRFNRGDTNSMSGYIFLPYDFNDAVSYVQEFKYFLAASSISALPILKLRNHPHQINSTKHIRLMADLEKCMLEYQDRFDALSARKVSVLIGATAAILEALERGIDVIHICTDPVFESHCEKIWDNLYVVQISSQTFEYSLKEVNQYIHLGSGEDLFEEYFAS